MLLKDIRYFIRKADIILFPILPLNKTIIMETIDILRYLIKRLGLKSLVKNKIVPIKGNYLTVGNMIYILYKK